MQPPLIIDGTSLHYRLDGDRARPCVMLCNSLGTDLSMWDAQAEALTSRFFVVRHDSRGHGQSGLGAESFGIDRLGLDVIALLDHLRIERAAVCGISMGGLVGQWLALHHPQRLTALVLANTAARIGSVEGWQGRAALVRSEGMDTVADGAAGRWFTAPFIARETATVARMVDTLRRQDAGGYAACCEALAQADLRAWVAAITVPTLVIAGEHDPVTTVNDAHELRQAIAGARLATLDASHLSNVEAPAAFGAALREFLRS